MRISRRSFALSAIASPLIAPTVSHAQNATPTSSEFNAATLRQSDLLQHVPGANQVGTLDLCWNDYARQRSAVRSYIGDSAAEVTDLLLAYQTIHADLPPLLHDPRDLEDAAGYAVGQLAQSVQFGTPPNYSILMKVDVPAKSLIPFWESVGYASRENDHGVFWTLGENGDLDTDHPVQQKLLNWGNNVAIIDDHVIAYTQQAPELDQIMATAFGDIPNRVNDLEPFSAELPEDTVSARYHDGQILRSDNVFPTAGRTPELVREIEEMLAESDDAVGAMPVIRNLCFGMTAGNSRDENLHNPESSEFFFLETDEEDMAEQAAKTIEWRVENLRHPETTAPYSNLLPHYEIDVLDGNLLRITAHLVEPVSKFLQLIDRQNTVPFAYTAPSS